MDYPDFNRFASTIRSLSDADLQDIDLLRAKFRMASDGPVEICYAPMEYLNRDAQVVVVGITPGGSQMQTAFQIARDQLALGADTETTLRTAKRAAGFSGSLRTNLIEMLDHVGLQHWLSIPSCKALFEDSADRFQPAAVLRYPVFYKGDNYRGTPNMLRHPVLRDFLLSRFAQDIQVLRHALFVPLGEPALEAMQWLVEQGLVDRQRVVPGIPHPSGANNERISYFLERPTKRPLSAKTKPGKLDQGRAAAIAHIRGLPAL